MSAEDGLRVAVERLVEAYSEEQHSDECGFGPCVHCVVDEFRALLAEHQPTAREGGVNGGVRRFLDRVERSSPSPAVRQAIEEERARLDAEAADLLAWVDMPKVRPQNAASATETGPGRPNSDSGGTDAAGDGGGA